MPTIDITKTVNNLAGVTGLSFTATAVQGTNTYPLTVTYNHPNLNLKSSGSVGTSGDFTFNIIANYIAFGVPCSDNVSFTETILCPQTINTVLFTGASIGGAFSPNLGETTHPCCPNSSAITSQSYNTCGTYFYFEGTAKAGTFNNTHSFGIYSGSGLYTFERIFANDVASSTYPFGTFGPGDVLKIEVSNTIVNYYKNNILITTNSHSYNFSSIPIRLTTSYNAGSINGGFINCKVFN